MSPQFLAGFYFNCLFGVFYIIGGFIWMHLIGLCTLATVLILSVSKLANTAEKEGEGMNM